MRDIERELAASLDDLTGLDAAEQRFIAAAADGWLTDVVFDVIDSPLGELVAAMTPRGLAVLHYTLGNTDATLEEVARRLSPRMISSPKSLQQVARQLDEFFKGKRKDFDLQLDWSLLHGFTRKVLQVTARIPYGKTLTYSEVAAKAGSPRGMRATGNALGANPIPIIVPCHRVLRSDGTVGGYTGGPEKKIHLLQLEGRL